MRHGISRDRIKNLLSVTRALASQTEVAERSAEEYRDDFLGRLDALGRSVGASRGRTAATLPDLVRAVMEPYRNGTSTLSLATEPVITLAPKRAMSLGMILHELATNAVKYGALSAPKGQLAISWSLEAHQKDCDELHLCWEESGGPRVTPPEETGFGTRLIQFAVEYDLQGHAELDYRAGGLLAKLTVPQL